MRVLIIEPHATGHHASYVRWLVEAVERRKWCASIATTTSALSHPVLRELRSNFESVEIHLLGNSRSISMQSGSLPRLLWREISYWRVFRRAVDEIVRLTPVDFIVLPYVDYCFYAMAILGGPFRGIPWCGISMRLGLPGADASVLVSAPWKWRLAGRILRESSLRALFVINPSVEDVPKSWYAPELRERLRYLPDPAEDFATASRHPCRTAAGIPDSIVTILVFGSIDDRKGVDLLLRGLASGGDLERYTVILAGNQSADMRAHLQESAWIELRSRGRLIVRDCFLSDSESEAIFLESDVVWVGYRDHAYMSGVLVLAGRSGVPVIGTGEGEIGRAIAKYGCGIATRVHEPSEVADALRKMLDGDLRRAMGRRARAAFAAHTVENFGSFILDQASHL